ncbi:hypothetical protein ACJW30_09G025500 [Castanea mollissima]
MGLPCFPISGFCKAFIFLCQSLSISEVPHTSQLGVVVDLRNATSWIFFFFFLYIDRERKRVRERERKAQVFRERKREKRKGKRRFMGEDWRERESGSGEKFHKQMC